MARAPIRTPGKTVVEEETTTTTKTEVTSTASTPVQEVNQSEQEQQAAAMAEAPSYEDLQAQINEMKQLLASQNQNQTSVVSEPVAQHVRTRDVIGPHGWTKEVI